MSEPPEEITADELTAIEATLRFRPVEKQPHSAVCLDLDLVRRLVALARWSYDEEPT